MKEIKINLEDPADRAELRSSQAGTALLLSGIIYSARDAAHQIFKSLFEKRQELPLSLRDAIIYYMGPSPTRPGYPIGSCGPTSSCRMDEFLETTLKLGVIATIGKGERCAETIELIRKYQAPYLLATGGAAAYLAECIQSSRIVLFEELGAEAVTELIVKDFPVIVGIDSTGKNLFSNRL